MILNFIFAALTMLQRAICGRFSIVGKNMFRFCKIWWGIFRSRCWYHHMLKVLSCRRWHW